MKKNNQQDLEQQGMDYLQSIPRRWVTIYIPLGIFVFVLLFPFYWMAMTAFKPNEEMLSSANPFWVIARSEEHTSELQSLMRISYAVFCLKKKKNSIHTRNTS